MLLSFVIPCYHSAATLPEVVSEIKATVERDGRYGYEIILVNDNPPDDTYEVIRRLAREDRNIKGICMSRNFGQHAALMAGYREVQGDIVISLDDDGQTPADQLFRLVEALKEDVDVVYARYPSKKHSQFRNFGTYMNEKMAVWLLGKPKNLHITSYFAMRPLVVEQIVQYHNPYSYVEGLVLRATSRVINVPVEHRARESGESGYTFSKLLSLWLNGFTAFSVKPLRVGTLAGTVLMILGFLSAMIVLVQKLRLGDAIDAGWSSLMCLLLVLGGLILAMLGLLGEYIGRIYVSISAAPQYVIRERCGGDRPKEPE